MADDELLGFGDEAEDIPAPVAPDVVDTRLARKGLAPATPEVDWGLDDEPAPQTVAKSKSPDVDWGKDDKPAGLIENPPLPRARPSEVQPTQPMPEVQPLDDAPFRSGGSVLDKIMSVKPEPGAATTDGASVGMLSGNEAYKQGTGRIAAAENAARAAAADLEVKQRSYDDALGAPRPENAGTGPNPEVLRKRKALADAQTAKDAADQDLATARRAPLPTQSGIRDTLERAPDAAVGIAADTMRAAQRPVMGAVDLADYGLSKLFGTERHDVSEINKNLDDASRDIKNYVGQNLFRKDQAQNERLGSKVVEGVVSTGMFAAGGVAGKAIGISPTVATAVLGALPQAEQQVQQAQSAADISPDYAKAWLKNYGVNVTSDQANEMVKWSMFATGLGIGATEAVPIGHLFERLEHASGGGLTRYLGVIAAQAGEEGVQEGVQQLLQNAVTLGLLDPNQDISKDVADNAMVGALSGAMVTGVMAAPTALQGHVGTVRDNLGIPTPNTAQVPPETIMEQAGAPQPAPAAEPGPAQPEQTSTPAPAQAALVAEQPVAAPAPPAAPEQPSPTVSPDDTALLRGYGYTDEQIADMSPAQRAAEVDDARAAGTEADWGTTDQAVGTRAAPVQVESANDIASTSGVVNTEPTEAQKAAGNYQKQHVKWDGLDITVENPKGSTRSGTDANGQAWQTTLPGHYGYIKRTRGADGDQVDVYLGDHLTPDGNVYVVDQNGLDGKFDEHKAIMGVRSEDEARSLYEQGFSDGKGAQRLGAITTMSPMEFKDWLRNGDTTKPVVQTKEVRAPAQPKSSDPTSLLQFIASKGGLKPDGELSALGVDGKQRVQIPGRRGFFGVVRSGGMSLDAMREAAEEAGYFRGSSGTSTVRDFLDAIDGEMRGQRRHAEGEEGASTKRDQEQVDEENANRATVEAEHRTEIEDMLRETGIPVDLANQEDIALAARIMADEGLSPDDALERAAIRNLRNAEEDGSRAVTDDEVSDTFDFGAFDAVQPEPTSANVATPSEEGGERERSGEEGQPSEPSGDVPRPVEDRPAEVGEADRRGVEAGHVSGPGQADRVSGETGEDAGAERAEEAAHAGLAADQGVTASQAIETALDTIEESVEAGDRKGVLDAARAARKVLVDTPQAVKDTDPDYWNQFDSVIRKMTKPGYVTGKQQAEAATTEQTEAGEQTVLPGAEKIGDGELAQRKTDENLKPKVSQKPADEGLFGDESKQTDLLDIKPPPPPKEKPATEARESGPSDSEATLADAFAKRLLDGETFPTILSARKLAKDEFSTTDLKKVEEQFELGMVNAAREVVQREDDPAKVYPELVKMYAAQPRLGTRTSTSMRDQAFSTPVPLAYLASRLARIEQADVVFEPTAGNGALLIETNADQTVIANELNPDRAANLKAQGYNVTSQDAVKPTQAQAINTAYEGADVVIENPPFGTMKENGKSTVYDLSDIQPGYKTTQIDHAIALRSLVAMRDEGRAVLIVGGLNKMKTGDEARSDGYNGKDKREFYKTLYDRYNVVDHFTVAGQLYERQGAGWPVDVIVIDGRGKSARALPAVDVPRVYSSWDQLGELLNASQSDARTARGQDGAVNQDDTSAGSAVPVERVRPPAGGRGLSDRVATPDDATGILAGPVADQSRNDAAGRTGVADELQSGERRDAGRSDLAPAAERRAPRLEQETERQVAYQPRSAKTNSLGTLVPVNMRTSVQESLGRIADRVGSIDDYVANELGYTPDELSKYFGAEQVDALALAIDNLRRGKGFIIGDQTGIGKGRVNAAIIRWAIKNGRIPVFVTEKPNLYGDMYRDLNDIGISDDFLDGQPRILATNADVNVPLTDDGKVVLRTPPAKVHNAELSALTTSNFTDKYDMVFTNYSQMQTLKGENTPRRGFLSNIIHNAVLIFDESHNAGGQDQTRKAQGEKADRAGFARDLVNRANGVFYSSATYAKRPDVMDLYSATDMTMAVAKPSDLGEAIAKGGVPMQQVVATMLAQAGQYVRRERSFAGVTYDTPLIDVDREAYDGISRSLSSILRFSDYVKAVADRLDQELKASASGTSFDNAVGDASAKSTSFTSVMHNIINQMLLAMKAEGAASRAITAIKDGQKPVITLANTMESFLKQFADDTGIAPGGIIDASFGDVLRRYLDRTRTLLIKKPYAKAGEVQRKYLSDKELGGIGRSLYASTLEQINKMDLDNLPVSPIDAIKDRIRKAGYTVGEITGRGTIVDYSGDQPILKPRPGSETSIRGRRQTIADFNSGKLDAVILNQAGATGLSLHASEKFKDQRQRKMIIAQAEANIDTHMQMLGRVHRTGQVVTPEYEQLVANIPAEKRPAAVLAKKMASLNANTTASRGGALTAKDVPDFINEYGDVVAGMYVAEHPEMNALLGDPIKFKDNGGIDASDAMRKLTGRIPLLPLKQQEDLYDHLESEYDAFLKQMEASGENALEAKTYDLKAKTLDSVETVGAKAGGGSPFAAPVVIDRVSAVRLGKPFSSHEVVQRAFDTINARENFPAAEITKENAAERYAALLKTGPFINRAVALEPYKAQLAEFEDYRRGILDDITTPDRAEKERVKLDAIKDRWKEIISQLPIGQRVTFKTATGNLTGIVTKIEQKGQPKNPLALSSWKVTAAIADASRQVTIPVSRLWPDGKSDSEDPFAVEVAPIQDWLEKPEQTLERFDTMQSDAREERFIATGNLLAAYDWLNKRGRIINYTDDAGSIRQGILTPSDFDLDSYIASRPSVMHSARDVVDYLEGHKGTSLWSQDQVVRVSISKAGKLSVATDSAKKTGGQFYLDRQLTNLTGDFIKTGGTMRAETWGSFEPVIQRLQELGAVFEAQKEAAPTAATGTRFSLGANRIDRAGAGTPKLSPQMRARIEQALSDVVEKIAGPDVAVRFVDTYPLSAPAQGWGEFRPDVQTAAGSYIPAQALITVALNDPTYPLGQVLETTYHEAFHAVEDRLLTDQEMEVLKRENDRLRDIIQRAYGFTDREIKSIAGFEVRAMAFQKYAADRARGQATDGLHIGIRGAFERLLRIFRQIRNLLSGLGFRNADDILRQVYDGEVADRSLGQTETGEQFNIHQAVNTPLQARGNLNNFESYEPLPENWRDWWKQPNLKWSDRVWGMIDAALLNPNRALGDRYVDMRRLQAAVEFTGKQINEGVDMALAATLFEGRTESRLKNYWLKMWKPALDEIAKDGIAREELHQYLYARHAPERNAHIAEINPAMPDGGSGMTNEEAQEIMDRFAAEGKREALERAARMIDGIVRRIRSTMVSDQLEHEETIKGWADTYQHYVPLKGFEAGDDSIAAVPGRSSGFDVRGPETKAALGRSSKADDILSNLFLMGERTIIRGEQNRVGRTAMRFMQSNPHPDIYAVQRSERVLTDGRPETVTENDLDLLLGERPVTVQRINRETGLVETVTKIASPLAKDSFAVKVGGHTYYIQIKHPGLLTALKNVGVQRLPALIQAHAWLTRQFSAFRTARNPDWFVSNLFRDVQDAAYTLSAEQRSELLKHFAANVGTLRTYIAAVMGEMAEGEGRIGTMARRKFAESPKARLYEDWKKNGGQIAFMGLHDLEGAKKEIEAAFNATKESPFKTALMAGPSVGKNILKGIEFFNSAIEAGTRLAVYDAALKAGMTKAKAAQLSKESTTNFNRKGIYTPFLNSFYAFFNARVQGAVKIVRLLRVSKMARRVALGLVLGGFATTMWNLAASGDDDEDKKNRYAKRKYWEREKYFIFYMPGSAEPIRFPMGYGLQLFWMLGENMAMASQGHISPAKAAVNYLSTMFNAFSPITSEGSPGDPGTWLRMIMPSLEMPLLELTTNENWRRRPIHPRFGGVGEPHSQQHFTTTSPTAIDVAQFLNRYTGGDAFTPGAIDVYPGDVQYVWEFAGGGLGQTADRTNTMIRNWIAGVPTPANQIPIVRHFRGADTKQSGAEGYYDDQHEVQEGMARVRRALKDENPARAADARKTVEEGYDRFDIQPGKRKGSIKSEAESIFLDAQKELKDLRTQEAQVRADPSMNRKQKSDLIDTIRENMRQVQDEARKAYRQIKAPTP